MQLIMDFSNCSMILGSRSPRRKDLLALLVPEENIRIEPPHSSEEKTFEGLNQWDEILHRAVEISEEKMEAVSGQIKQDQSWDFILTADTIVIVQEEKQGDFKVLGQPPDISDWKSVVREWFQKYYLNKDHYAVTAFTLMHSSGQRTSQTVETTVRFRDDSLEYLPWYLETEESVGKAGGYGIQGKGTIFVDRLEGSLSNVIGLPLTELASAMDQLT